MWALGGGPLLSLLTASSFLVAAMQAYAAVILLRKDQRWFAMLMAVGSCLVLVCGVFPIAMRFAVFYLRMIPFSLDGRLDLLLWFVSTGGSLCFCAGLLGLALTWQKRGRDESP